MSNKASILVAPTPATADTVQLNYIKSPPEFTSTTILFFLQTKNQCYYMEY